MGEGTVRDACEVCGAAIPASSEFCPVCALRAALGQKDATSELTQHLPDVPQEFQFGHYLVLTRENGELFELGRGAMGITYKAFDVDLRYPVALKVIGTHLWDDEFARLRFLREARAAARVRHPNVASVFHLGKSGQDYFYAMEFVEGETLDSFIKRRGRLEAKLALELARQIAAGLEAIHRQSLVHRDIKPNNVMVSFEPGGRPIAKIIDLGLAKPVQENGSSPAISIQGVFAGTPAFASPEQFAGIGVDIRSDLYSLGVTLWQMLAGRTPFHGTPNEVRYQHQHVPLPLKQLSDVPQPLLALLQLLLAKGPADRFQTPAELLNVLPLVLEAVERSRQLLRTIRVLITAGSDVQKERNLAYRLMQSVAGELNAPVSDPGTGFQRLILIYHDRQDAAKESDEQLILCPQFWDLPKEAIGKDSRVPDPAEFEQLISIVWSQLGELSNSELRLPDGTVPDSLPEYQIAWTVERAGSNRSGQVRIFHHLAQPTPPLEPKADREAFLRQWDLVQAFLIRWEKNESEQLVLENYRGLEEFEELFREQFRRFLALRLEREIGSRPRGRKTTAWNSNPFRGLNVFDFEHAPIFYGRTKAIGEILGALEQQLRASRPFVLVVGASGSGKSSLLRAGVLPLLTQPGTIEGIGLWRWAVTSPGAGGSGDCFDALAAALLEPSSLPSLQDAESKNPVSELAAELREHGDAVAPRIRDALDQAAREQKRDESRSLQEKEEGLRNLGRLDEANFVRQQREALELPRGRLALVVDQMEELFTSGLSQDLQQKYIATIVSLARSSRVFVLAALRSDFYSSYQQFSDLIDLTRPGGKIDLRPPSPHEIGAMIRMPAVAAGLRFEQDPVTGQRLDDALRDAAASTPESLPLLEHVLLLLYGRQAARGDQILRWSDYRELGELKGALAQYAESAFAALGQDEQSAFPLVMRGLVTLGQGEDEVPNRRTVPYRDFSGDINYAYHSEPQRFVDHFVEKRLLVADRDPQGEVTISVAHEALLREWQRVKEWLVENREFLRMRDRLDSSLRLWSSRGRQKDDLLGPGLPIAEGEKLLADFGSSLSAGQTEYVRASINERTRQHKTRERVRLGVLASIVAALIVAVIFAIVSFSQYRRAEHAKVSADEAANRATLARNEAQGLINFMTIDLRDKLKPIGRLDLLDDVNWQVKNYYDRLTSSDKSPEVVRQRSIALVNSGDISFDRGDLVGALKTYQEAMVAQNKLIEQNPKNITWQRDLSESFLKIGEVLRLQGNIDGALEDYRESLRICKELVAKNSSDATSQLGVSDSLERIGFVLTTQGNVQEALKTYQESLPGLLKLANLDPNNVPLQIRLSSAYENIGTALGTQGNWDGALQNYRNELRIRQELVNHDPGNADLQHYLSTCLNQIGFTLVNRGDAKEALDSYRRATEIARALNFRDSSNTRWKRDFAISLEGVGDSLVALGQYAAAEENYKEALNLREELTLGDLSNLTLASDRAWSYQEIGDVLLAQKHFPAALESYYKSCAITRWLTEVDPRNNERQSDLAIICEKTAEAFSALGNSSEALKGFRESLAICKALTKIDPGNAQWASDEATACYQIGITLSRLPDSSPTEILSMLKQARSIFLNLNKRSELSAANRGRLEKIQALLNDF
jgi:serine/threonine protein kinase/tetratricopeptide (TPR) repeat protein